MKKAIIIPALVIAATVIFVGVNSAVSCNILSMLINELEESLSTQDFTRFEEHFEEHEAYLSFMVKDDSLCEIRSLARELESYAKSGSEDEVMAAKSRLYSRLVGERRLLGFNISSIF